MYHFMRKYNKKLLAVFAAGLMVVFILPSSFKNSGMGYDANVLGKFPDGKTLTVRDVTNAQAEWRMLSGGSREGVIVRSTPTPNPMTGRPQYQPIANLVLPQHAIAEMQRTENAPMFALLLKEARDMGVSIPQSSVDIALTDVGLYQPDGSVIQIDGLSEETKDFVRQAMHDLLMVSNAFERAVGVVKVSQPLLNNLVADQAQEIKLRLLEFKAKDYTSGVTTPTPEQLNEQFNHYRNMLPAEFEAQPETNPLDSQSSEDVKARQAANPFGFGYKYPDRVKLQYVAIVRDEVRKGIRAAQTGDTPEDKEYHWTVEAQKEYQKNPQKYASTQPTTKAAGAATAPSTVASTVPAIKPFAEVREQIIASLIEPRVDGVIRGAINKVSSQMAGDYVAWKNATGGKEPTTGPSTTPAAPAPMTGLGVPYDSLDYMLKLSELVQREQKFKPTVVSLQDKPLNRKELADLPAIGKADMRGRSAFITFPDYAIGHAAAFNPTSEEAIHVLEPSKPLEAQDTYYVFRLTSADPAHAPADLAEVRPQVEQDVRTVAAYNLAKAAAEKVVADAQKSDLRTAAQLTGRLPVDTGAFGNDARFPVSGYDVPANSKQRFMEEGFNLLSVAAKENKPHPVGLIELPRDGRALAAELADVRLDVDPQQLAGMRSQLAQMEHSQLAAQMFDQWFDYDALKHRTEFQEPGGRKKAS